MWISYLLIKNNPEYKDYLEENNYNTLNDVDSDNEDFRPHYHEYYEIMVFLNDAYHILNGEKRLEKKRIAEEKAAAKKAKEDRARQLAYKKRMAAYRKKLEEQSKTTEE